MNTPRSTDESIIEELSKGLEIERQLLELAPLFCSRIKNKKYARALRGYKERTTRNIAKLEMILRGLAVEPARIALDKRYYGSLIELRTVVSGKRHKGNDRVIIRPLRHIEDMRILSANWPCMIYKRATKRPDYIGILKLMVTEAVELRDKLDIFDGEMMTDIERENWRIALVRSGMLAPKPGDEIDDTEDDYFPIC